MWYILYYLYFNINIDFIDGYWFYLVYYVIYILILRYFIIIIFEIYSYGIIILYFYWEKVNKYFYTFINEIYM